MDQIRKTVAQMRQYVYPTDGGTECRVSSHTVQSWANAIEQVFELIEAAKDIRDNPGADCRGTVGFCAIELPKLERLKQSLAAIGSSR